MYILYTWLSVNVLLNVECFRNWIRETELRETFDSFFLLPEFFKKYLLDTFSSLFTYDDLNDKLIPVVTQIWNKRIIMAKSKLYKKHSYIYCKYFSRGLYIETPLVFLIALNGRKKNERYHITPVKHSTIHYTKSSWLC